MANRLEDGSEAKVNVYLIINRQVVPLRRDLIRLGRHMENEIVFHEEVISRFHAEIHREGKNYVLYDKGSTGGTFVNGRRVDRCVLNSGDLVSLASVQFMFVNNAASLSERSRVVTQSLQGGQVDGLSVPKERSILIIDDEPALLVGLEALLKRRGYRTLTANNGADGLEAIRKQKPDLVLSDVMMPAPNGFEIKQQLSLDPALAKIPFIFLTARAGNEDRIAGIRSGADDYIVKPFDRDELLARIEAVFRRIETERSQGRDEMRLIAQQEMERLRSEVLHNIHHELRTPLMNVMMPLELAVSRKFDNPEEQLSFLRMAFSNLERLESLISDLIILTDLDHGRLNTIRQPIDVENNLVKPIQKRLERYREKNLSLDLHAKPVAGITAPRRELCHVVLHLVDNAFKFSPPNREVKVAIRKIGLDGIVVDVLDQGPGIPAELREKVFERFYQISQGDSRSFEGLGVGLTLARSVAEANGGYVRLMDSLEGCHVQLAIPASS